MAFYIPLWLYPPVFFLLSSFVSITHMRRATPDRLLPQIVVWEDANINKYRWKVEEGKFYKGKLQEPVGWGNSSQNLFFNAKKKTLKALRGQVMTESDLVRILVENHNSMSREKRIETIKEYRKTRKEALLIHDEFDANTCLKL